MNLDIKNKTNHEIFDMYKERLYDLFDSLNASISEKDFYNFVLKKIEESKYIYLENIDYIDFLECEIDLDIFISKYQYLEKGIECTTHFYDDYINFISKFPLLNLRQEKALFRRLKCNDESSENILLLCNLKLVVSEVNKIYNYGKIDKIDLIQEGNIGLWESIIRYDCEQGNKFSTYATYRIRRYIIRAFNKQKKNIKYPDYIYTRMFKFSEVKNKLEYELNREPTLYEIANSMKISLKDAETIALNLSEIVSLDSPADNDDSLTIGGLIVDYNSRFEEEIENKEILEQFKTEIYQILENYTERQQKCIKLRCGLIDGCCMTLDNVSKIVGVSRESVRLSEKKFYKDRTKFKINFECLRLTPKIY